MWICAYVHTGDHRVKELETLELDKQIGGCELPSTGAKNGTRVLCKSNLCFPF